MTVIADGAVAGGLAYADPDTGQGRLYRDVRRERIATAVLTGLVISDDDGGWRLAAEQAVGYADALIAELDK